MRKIVNGVITTVAGNGTPGFSGNNRPATDAQLGHVEGIAVDSAGNLYIADSNTRIRKVVNGVITTVAGNGTLGHSGDVHGPSLRAMAVRRLMLGPPARSGVGHRSCHT